MSVTKIFKIIDPRSLEVDVTDNKDFGGGTAGLYGNYTWYHRLVAGSPNRLVRYREYDIMDADVDIARALDIIAEEVAGNNPKTETPLQIKLELDGGVKVQSRVVATLNAALKTWCNIHDWKNRIFKIARNTVKYGDSFYMRPQKKNSRYIYAHSKNVVGAIVSQHDITDIKGWHIKTDARAADNSMGSSGQLFYNVGGNIGDANIEKFNADDVIRFSLNDEMSDEAPFGKSILTDIYRAFKQKELLEDAILIYRIQRAPERLVFNVDVSHVHPAKVAHHLEQIKNEMKQKKIPSMNGGQSTVESTYNPQSMCLALDTEIPLLDGRMLSLQELITEYNDGKENWVYSIDPNAGNIVPGIISWAGITQNNVETIKLHLDNGDIITCTPEHKFPVQGKGFIEAKNLTETDSLWPFESTYENIFVVKIKTGLAQDVGTLTIDGNHLYHSHHTFALKSCFTRNSENYYVAKYKDGAGTTIDTIQAGCLDLSTKIPLLDGRTLSLEEMITEYKEGKTNWIYSVNIATGESIPGIVSWAGITHENAEVYEIILDNGESVITTGDHKFPVYGKNIVQTKDLEENDSIIPFNTRLKTINGQNNTYQQIYDNSIKKWKFTHRIVRDYQDSFGDINTTNSDEFRKIIHHSDFNRYNNNPNNLLRMGEQEHLKYHQMFAEIGSKAAALKYHSDPVYRELALSRLSKARSDYRERLKNDPIEANRYETARIAFLNKYIYFFFLYYYYIFYKKFINTISTSSSALLNKQETDPEFKKMVYEKSSKTFSNRISVGGDLHEKWCKHLDNVRVSPKNQNIIYTKNMIAIVRYLMDMHSLNKTEMLKKLNNTDEFIVLWNVYNKPESDKICRITTTFKEHHLLGLLQHYGYDSWRNFQAERMSLNTLPSDEYKEKINGLSANEAEWFKTIIDLTKKYPNAYNLAKVLNSDEVLKEIFINKYNEIIQNNKRCVKQSTPLSNHHLDNVAIHYGYSTFKQFTKEKNLFNHRVVSVKKLNGMRPVGTITVDQNEQYNQQHMFALGVGIYTKNSNLGELQDLVYWYKKMWRGLRIPESYIDNTSEGATSNDGKVGIAYLQEIKFSLYIERLQSHLEYTFDREFKRFLRDSNILIDESIFKIILPTPSNYDVSRKQAIDNDLLSTFSTADGVKTLSKRFALKHYLQLTDDQIIMNERMLREERGLDPNGDYRDLPKLYDPEGAEAGGFEGGLGSFGGGSSGGGGGMPPSGDLGGDEEIESEEGGGAEMPDENGKPEPDKNNPETPEKSNKPENNSLNS